MKINKFYFCFFLIVFLMFLGSMNTILTYIALIGTVVCAILIGNYYLKSPSEEVCVGIIYLLVFQNFCIGTGAHLMGNNDSMLKYITQVPFLSIAIIWIINQFSYIKNGKYRIDKAKKSFIFLLICIAFSLLVGRGNIQSILVNLRNLTVFYMAFEIGKYKYGENTGATYTHEDFEFNIPYDFIFKDALPLTGINKIDFRTLEKEAAEMQ